MATGETNFNTLLKNMTPVLNEGDYVYCTTPSLNNINTDDIIAFFKEAEAPTLILKKETADKLNLEYSYVAAWITLPSTHHWKQPDLPQHLQPHWQKKISAAMSWQPTITIIFLWRKRMRKGR
ncbi:MAG: hypothetical protein JWQ57_3956 [Mucilaginibacter sp.]|nr:hypothetical protein [Mucilaginibacter sp.]